VSAPEPRDERWLTFEVGGMPFALPILDVFEVSEVGRIGPVPSLPRALGGVMHYHGDALPIVSPSALLDVAAGDDAAPEHVVVVAANGGDTPRLGLPVGRVLGLVNAPPPATRQAEPVTARLPVDGRVIGILDARHLCDRAAELVAGSAEHGSNDSEQWGETT
jgi:chemotaxis signal transduction protein